MDTRNEDEATANETDAGSSVSRRTMLGIAGGVIGAAGMASAASAQTQETTPSRFAGKVAVITGVARGMGRAHAVLLASNGATIVGCDILEPIDTLDYPLSTQADMDETARLVEEAGGRFVGIKADVRNSQAANSVVERATQDFGRVDFLLANAGIFSTKPLAEMSDQQFDDVVQTNLYGVFNIMRAAVPPMTRQNYGRIIATSSAAGRMGIGTMSHYCASKWAVIGLTKALALEVAKQGITVNCICPTGVNTPLTSNPAAWRRALPDDPNPTREKYEERMRANAFTPQGVPWVEPEDIAAAALFLLSDDADHITGTALDVAAGGAASTMA
ncbi:mycofactocin-coupled SDR family oxidoreductase [Brucella anthropi]|uniref:mycofactocin-coupled SDR family oxidoreductase n=1 Tax=Brucella anthropi TaxID=529 RepID=UPI00215854D1|nr:mycofactocin-coupled SDR family oxidoreductase [Brucella anthropi]MCR8492667.1 mycofactocin-coupled SDR family oxidoreductase [Brucella anthropi]